MKRFTITVSVTALDAAVVMNCGGVVWRVWSGILWSKLLLILLAALWAITLAHLWVGVYFDLRYALRVRDREQDHPPNLMTVPIELVEDRDV